MTTEIVIDMESSDPDDFFALCFLTSHPAVRLQAVTVNPGSRAQIGLVRRVLELTQQPDVPVGSLEIASGLVV